jgi:transposase-like protein
MRRRSARVPAPRSSFAGFRFPPDVIMMTVRWYLRYGLSYRDVEELPAERGIAVDHVTIYRWVQHGVSVRNVPPSAIDGICATQRGNC